MKFDHTLIKQLMEAMDEHQVRRIFLKSEEDEIEIEKQGVESALHYVQSPIANVASLPSVASTVESSSPSTSPSYLSVTSPFVGTFYSAPSPTDTPFVKEGDLVDEESVVCIVEAMKVMNEVKAGVNGRVTKLLLKSGDPVEFGTEILHVDPS